VSKVAELVVVSRPEQADVYRGIINVGQTPLTLTPRIKAGEVIVLLVRKKNFEPQPLVVRSDELVVGEPKLVSVTLERVAPGKKAVIELITVPSGAEVHEGARFVGITPLVLDRATWREVVLLDVHAEGYAARQILLALRREPQVVNLDLRSDGDPIPGLRQDNRPTVSPP
jgi:hypothetical protein